MLATLANFASCPPVPLRVDQSDKVKVVSRVPVGLDVDSVVDEPDLGPDVELMLLLVGQLAVLDAGQDESGLLH